MAGVSGGNWLEHRTAGSADQESTRPAEGRRPAQPGERSEAAQRPKLNLEPTD